MKTNKEQILDLIRLHFSTGSGASTQYVADALGIKRSNASALLNELVEEGLLEKSGGRPVLYGVKASEAKDYECFDSLVGKDGSLARATKLIKAAAQYPGKSLNVFITGDKGTGKSLLAYVAHQFSLESGVLLPDALYRTLDCRDYEGDERKAESALFGDGASGGLFAGMRRGFLVVDNAHLLNSRLRGMLCDAAESDDDGSYPAVAVIAESGAHEAATEFRRRLPITIELPTLAERPFEERLELVQRFFTLEAARAGRDIAISAELLRCLLLYDCEFNVSQLKGDIKIACANAYVRDIASKGGSIEVVIGDFDNYVRKGFLNYRKHRDEIERLIDPDYSYSFSSVSMKMSPIDRDKLRYSQNIYSDLNRRAGELRAHGLGEKDISLLLETELEANFNTYRAQLARRVINSEQLSKLVDERIIELVEEFLASASEKFGESYPASVHYGLCLHIDSALKKTQRTQALTPAQISDIVEKHKEKYLLSFRFAAKLEKAFSVELPTDEVVLIAMFICFDAPYANAAGSPSLLLVFHGAGIATALAASVNTVTGLGNVSALDIPYGLTTEKSYEQLKECIKREDTGSGVFVIYDTDATRVMLDSISLETGGEIRYMQLAVTQVCVDWARSAAANTSIDGLYRSIMERMDYYGKPIKRVIVTLCTTGTGGAEQLKSYIERFGEVGDCEIIPLAMTDREALREKLLEIMSASFIRCVVGTHDPKLFSLPFIPASEVLGVRPEELPEVLNFKKQEKSRIDFDEVYEYLDEHLEKVNIKKLKKTLPPFIERVNGEVRELSLDSEVGLFMHVACCINRLLEKETVRPNIHRDEIYAKYAAQFKDTIRFLKPLEETFGVIFSDDEVANILTIIYKL